MSDEPCMCDTPFTCLADVHDFEVANIGPEQRAEEAAYIAETVHPDHRAGVANVLALLRSEITGRDDGEDSRG